MSETPKWPFQKWLRLAVLQMGLTPDAFWSMDVIDWLTLCKREGGGTMSSADLDALQTQFPDDEVEHDD